MERFRHQKAFSTKILKIKKRKHSLASPQATAEGRTITPTRKWRKLKTTTKVTADELCKLFFERDILLDKLARRSDEVRGLRAALAAQ